MRKRSVRAVIGRILLVSLIVVVLLLALTGGAGVKRSRASEKTTMRGSQTAGDAHNGTIMKIPLFPLGTVLFPKAALPLHIFEERYREMVGECLRDEAEFGVVRAEREQMALVGCTAKIARVV